MRLGRAMCALFCIFAPLLVVSGPASAQALQYRPEDRIRELQEQQRESKRRRPSAGPIDITQPKVAAGDKSAATEKFTLKKIVVSRSAVLSNDRIRALVAEYEGREIALNDLNKLVLRINELYRAAGFPLGLAVLPPQVVQNDTLQIVLVEPRVAGIDVNSHYTEADYLASQIPLAKDQLIDLKALEDAVTLMRRKIVSGIQIGVRLIPGDAFGTTRIVLDVLEPPRHTLQTIFDNFGTPATGVDRNQTIYSNAGLFGRDDPFVVGTSLSKGSESVFGIYDAPIGISGLRLETQFSLSQSEVIGGNFSKLGLETEGQFLAAELKYPFILERDWALYGYIGGAYSNGSTQTGPLDVINTVGRLSGGVRAFYYDAGTTVEFDNEITVLRHRSHDNVGDIYGNYMRYNGLLSLSRAIGDFTLIGEAAWQWAPDHLLPSSEQFAFGGISTLRAYELNQFNGDDGARARLELRAPHLSISRFLGHSENAFVITPIVFAETGMAIPYRAVGDKVRREDFASDIGAGVNINILSGLVFGRALVAQSLDEIHEPLLTSDPKILLELGVKFQF